MSDELSGAPSPTIGEALNANLSDSTPSIEGEGNLSAREAALGLEKYRSGQREAPQTDDPATPISAQEDYEHQEPGDPVETTATEQPTPQESPIEPPRSWSKEEKERFRNLPPETQAYLTQRENDRDTALRRGQNEVAQQRQAIQQQLAKAQQVTQQYEQLIPALQAQLQQQYMGEFGDIRSQQDVEKMAAEDPARFIRFQAFQMKANQLRQEQANIQQRQQSEFNQRWSQFAQNEDLKFAQSAPHLSDPKVAEQVAKGAYKCLQDVGFNDQEISQMWNGQASVSARDSRFQTILMEAALYRQGKAAAAAKRAQTPVAKVVRPGSPAERVPDRDSEVTAWDKQLGKSGKWKDAAELLLARRSARR